MLKFQPLLENLTVRARLALFIGVAIVSFDGIFTRIAAEELTPIAITFDRLWITAISFLIFDWLRTDNQPGQYREITRKSIYNLIFSGLIRGFVFLIWAFSTINTSVTNLTLLRNLEPLFLPFFVGFSVLTLFDRRFWIGWVVAVSGMLGIVYTDINSYSENLIGDGYAVIASIFSTIFYLMKEDLIESFPVATMLKWVFVIAAILISPIAFIFAPRILPESIMVWLSILGLSILTEFIGHSFITYSLRYLSSGIVTLLLPLEAVLASATASVTLGESLSILNYLSCLVILGGVLVAASSSSTVKTAANQESMGSLETSPF